MVKCVFSFMGINSTDISICFINKESKSDYGWEYNFCRKISKLDISKSRNLFIVKKVPLDKIDNINYLIFINDRECEIVDHVNNSSKLIKINDEKKVILSKIIKIFDQLLKEDKQSISV